MEFYESHYFIINKRFCQCLGLWPYDSNNQKFTLRILFSIPMTAFSIPHFIGMAVNREDIDRLMEHICLAMFALTILFKYLATIIADKQMKTMFEDIISNWAFIEDEEEKDILRRYSQRGRFLTFAYLSYIVLVGIFFVFLPLTPILINKLELTAEPLPRLFLMNAEFLVDRNDHYWKIYFWDLSTTLLPAIIVIGVDTTYACCVEHCVGLFAIIKWRLRNLIESKYPTNMDSDIVYDRMTHIVKLHQRVIRFGQTLEDAYSGCFLMLIINNMIIIPILCVMVIMNLDQKIQLIRFFMLFSGLAVHMFYLTLAGQKLIDSSNDLFLSGYYNEWYKTSESSKNLLKFLMLRCTRPCELTAGGLAVMGMATFYGVMKTAISYITVIASFRY